MAKKKTGTKTGFSVQGYDLAQYKQTEQYVAAIERKYNQTISDIARLAVQGKINPDKPFSFSDYPSINRQTDQVIAGLVSHMTTVTQTGIKEAWLFACKKNDAFLNSILNTSKLSKKTLAKYQDRNLDALSAFQTRKIDGMNLSDRIWKQAEQFKNTMELGLDVGLGEGRSAQQLSRDLRQNLLQPDNLFRRVRDKRGQLQLSKAAKAFHPGQGVYRSSYKNAMRLTRSEVNMSYRDSDSLRWGKLDFVVGFEVKLSNNHPVTDICNDLMGKYPKSFIFKGWHPQCRCYMVPILQDPDEFDANELSELRSAFKGEEYNQYVSKKAVADVPDNFKSWMAKNQVKVDGYKSTPYFIKDNFKNGKIADGLRFDAKAVQVPTKPVKLIKTQAQKEDIQKRWNSRVAENRFSPELQAVADQYGDVKSISAFIDKIKSQIGKGAPVKEVSGLVDRLKNKTAVKEAWDVRKQDNALSKLLGNVKTWKKQFTVQELQSVYNAVETKLTMFEGLPVTKQIDKLNIEIKWVEDNKKYSTWQVAQDAYKKKLAAVEYSVQKQAVQDSLSNAFQFAAKTQSKNVKAMAAELKQLLANDAKLGALQSKAKALDAAVKKLEAKKTAKSIVKIDGLDENVYSQKRKDAALWAKTKDKADKELRPTLEKVWTNATPEGKRAGYEYTSASGGFNRPLRGYEGSWYESSFKGIGKVDLNYEGKAKQIQHLAELIDGSSYQFDTWLQRGVENSGTAAFLGVDSGRLAYMSQSELQPLVGKIMTDEAFVSCGSAKGSGFSGNIYNIYCPKGTKMIYAEPFSHYGGCSNGQMWDGASKTLLRSELETIIQKGTSFRITKIERSGGRLFIDMEVVAQ